MVKGKGKLLFIFLFVFSLFSLSALSVDNAIKFLNEANDLYTKEDYEGAYKYVNQAFLVARESIEESRRNNIKSNEIQSLAESILYFAQMVYSKKLELLLENYDELELLDIKANLERYPRINNSTIKKLLNLIEAKQTNPKSSGKIADYEAKLYELEEKRQLIAESQKEFSLALDDENKKISNDFINNTLEAKQSKKLIIVTLVALAVVMLFIALIIIIVWKRRFTHQQLQQEQYIQAFKVMASNNNQAEENISVLETVADIYSNKNEEKLAEEPKNENKEGEEEQSSEVTTDSEYGPQNKDNNGWRVESPVQTINISKEDEAELKKLAIKCEELGNKIDAVTGRKNNSKNVSEVVYKLSLELGVTPAMSMVNFCAAMIYDAGFLGIDPDLLNSISLNEEEKEAMKTHVALAKKYLKFVPKKYMSIFEAAAMKHHENMDGSGYPRGLSGGEIPQIARLIRVAESFISMSSKRLYRAPIDKEAAVEKLKEMPQFYDPVVVEALEKIV